jgi:hypothetical protein
MTFLTFMCHLLHLSVTLLDLLCCLTCPFFRCVNGIEYSDLPLDIDERKVSIKRTHATTVHVVAPNQIKVTTPLNFYFTVLFWGGGASWGRKSAPCPTTGVG